MHACWLAAARQQAEMNNKHCARGVPFQQCRWGGCCAWAAAAQLLGCM